MTVAVVDAYASPTVLSAAQEYASRNQPGQPLGSGQFSQSLAPKFNQIESCGANAWYGEETLDIEAVHATAPGANIHYVAAKNCGTGLYKAFQDWSAAPTARLPTSSPTPGGRRRRPLRIARARRSFDNVLLVAAATGIGVQFSSGDEGEEFINFGVNVGDYPTTNPFVTRGRATGCCRTSRWTRTRSPACW